MIIERHFAAVCTVSSIDWPKPLLQCARHLQGEPVQKRLGPRHVCGFRFGWRTKTEARHV